MQNLIQLIIRYGALITFLIFEFVCFYLVINKNQDQQKIYHASSALLSGQIYDQYDNFVKFWNLSAIADSVSHENAKLKSNLRNFQIEQLSKSDTITIDTAVQFIYLSAEVKNNSINKRNNTLTIDKGSKDGIETGMGVIDDDGIVGIVLSTSKNFSIIMSVLNSNTRISAAIKRSNYFGNLRWKGSNSQKVNLEDVPKHADIVIGDSIITSGYSSIFPSGIMIGKIEKFNILGGSNSYDIEVNLNNNLSKQRYVYVIKNILKEEQSSLEKEAIDE